MNFDDVYRGLVSNTKRRKTESTDIEATYIEDTLYLFQFQHVTWNEFLPRVLGWNAINLYELGLETDGFYDGYDEKCNPTIMNEFAAAAFRFGHSLLKPAFAQVNLNNTLVFY